MVVEKCELGMVGCCDGEIVYKRIFNCVFFLFFLSWIFVMSVNCLDLGEFFWGIGIKCVVGVEGFLSWFRISFLFVGIIFLEVVFNVRSVVVLFVGLVFFVIDFRFDRKVFLKICIFFVCGFVCEVWWIFIMLSRVWEIILWNWLY